MATADHTTFTQARTGSAQRIKRQPAKFRVRLSSEPNTREGLPVRQYKLSGVILAGAVLCATAYLLGLVIGSRL
jgi:hypothetical protein